MVEIDWTHSKKTKPTITNLSNSEKERKPVKPDMFKIDYNKKVVVLVRTKRMGNMVYTINSRNS